MDAFMNTSSTRKFPCCAKLGHGKSHDQVVTNPIPLSKLNLFRLVHNTYLRWIWSMTFTCIFAMGVLTYGGALWAIRMLSILLHCTNPLNLLKLHIPSNESILPITNFTKLCNNWWLWVFLKCSKTTTIQSLHNVTNSKGSLTTKG